MRVGASRVATRYGTVRPTSCCGLREVHALNAVPRNGNYTTDARIPLKKRQFQRGTGYFATTTRDQTAEVKALKASGFRRVGSWRNSNTGRWVTMWVKNIKRTK